MQKCSIKNIDYFFLKKSPKILYLVIICNLKRRGNKGRIYVMIIEKIHEGYETN
jgi:hypothetical protein